jgi:hypothetical protein
MSRAKARSVAKVASVLIFTFCGLCVSGADAQRTHRTAKSKQEFSPFCSSLPETVRAEPSKKNEETEKERAYYASVARFSRAWCVPGKIDADDKLKAVDSMVAAWKLFWDEDPSYNAEFHEQGASDLLALMGITHELPKQMRDDPKFVLEWVDYCNRSCFTIWGDPANPKDQAGILVQLQLWGDVLHRLKQEPATEPILDMLRGAQFRMVD